MFAQWGLWNEDRPRASLPVCPLSGGGLNRSTQPRCLLAAVFAIFDRAIPKEGTKIGFSGASVIWPVKY
jgi:hypothetical protein